MSFNSPISAIFIHEDESIDIIPQTALTAGSVVKISGNLIGITKCDIPANELGTLHLNGVYSVNKDTSTIAAGAKVYWNATTSKVGTTVTAYPLGTAVAAAASSDVRASVRLESHPIAEGITRQTEVAQLADNSGGIPQTSVPSMPSEVKDGVATIVSKLNAVILAMKNAGLFTE